MTKRPKSRNQTYLKLADLVPAPRGKRRVRVVPLRPDLCPAELGRQALELLERGGKRVSEVGAGDGEEVLARRGGGDGHLGAADSELGAGGRR